MDKLTPDKLKDKFKTSLNQLKRPNLRLPLLLSNTSNQNHDLSLAGQLLNKQDLSFSPEELLLPAISRHRDPGPDGEAARYPSDPLEDERTFEEIEKDYFQDNFDPSLFELQKLPEQLDESSIKSDSQKLLKQLNVVTKRLYDQILKKQNDYQREMEKAFDIQNELNQSLEICRCGRKNLASAREDFTGSSLGILNAFRRRQQASKLIQALESIKTLQQTDQRLQELLGEENFSEAIQVLLEYQKTVSIFSHFSAIKQLSSKIQDTLEMTEEQLDVAMSKVCLDFNPVIYGKLTQAYRMLGKTQSSMDQLHMHLTSAIHNTAWNVVYGHAVLTASSGNDTESDLAKKTYPDLCGCLASASILPCLVDLSRALWNIMYNYKQICRWHKAQQEEETSETKSNVDLQYVSKKLENGLARIWQDVQTKAKTFVLANDLTDMSIDNFLEFMDVIHKLIEVGHDFCGSDSDTLQESLKSQCWSYFHSYHLARLDELRMHIENEGWALCPVKNTFKVQQLVEFRHLSSSVVVSPRKISNRKLSFQKSTSVSSGTFVSPFDQTYDNGEMSEEEEEEVFGTKKEEEDAFYRTDEDDSSSDEEIEDLKKDFVDEGTGENNHDSLKRQTSKRASRSRKAKPIAPILTNTSLMLLRLWGKYLHLMRALRPIAFNVFASMTQLLEFYAFSVHHFFAETLSQDFLTKSTSSNLSDVLRRIDSDLILKPVNPNQTGENISSSKTHQSVISDVHKSIQSLTNSQSNSSFSGSPSKSDLNSGKTSGVLKIPESHFLRSSEKDSSTSYDSDPETLFGLELKLVAVESTIFLIEEFKSLKESFKQCLSEDQQSHLAHYEEETLTVLKHLRRPVYMSVVVKSIKTDLILQLMSKVAWDIKEVRSQHSQYVDVLLRDFQIFCFRLQEVRNRFQISNSVRDSLWDSAILCASSIFVEGFANAKRCSQEGRALMHLDFRQFVIKMEKLCDMKPLPYQDYVLLYIKGFYIPELDLESWVQQHTNEYTPKQLEALVNSVISSNNRNRKKYLNLIERISRR